MGNSELKKGSATVGALDAGTEPLSGLGRHGRVGGAGLEPLSGLGRRGRVGGARLEPLSGLERHGRADGAEPDSCRAE